MESQLLASFAAPGCMENIQSHGWRSLTRGPFGALPFCISSSLEMKLLLTFMPPVTDTGAFIGIGLGCIVTYIDLEGAPLAKFCDVPYWEDSFSTLDSSKWTREVQLDGFGTGSFDWTTTDSENAYVDEAGLHIVPTLTTESTNITAAQLLNGYRLNLTDTAGDGSCTAAEGSNITTACSIASNATEGMIINPVRSARLTTIESLRMKYGKIEVKAKLPAGSWLWPAIWMMPVNNVYGTWPQSGEIDIMESRGNDPNTYPEGRDTISSTIHWGPNSLLDGYWRKGGPAHLWRSDFSQGFHTFSIEWTPKYIFTYFDNKLLSTMYTRFGSKYGDMWQQGDFAGTYVNGSTVINPWSGAAVNAPFDQEFYLILNVAVGGTNGYWPDDKCYTDAESGQTFCAGDKPWRNENRSTAMLDFWRAKDEWLPTWGADDSRGMTVKSVKAFKYSGC
ncbi:Beta-1,3-glucan-binding protein [Pseudocercospora fuligena]|uniref:Beta-1,3-glucan-binding protein n=1 Tax=Pseudocercospora fuligena TaxID=685502 RepID=A0A8H6VFG7_9PEZI|nr:Beta-1,3-glucan-binding protein [Pseudocercospora fuligena]